MAGRIGRPGAWCAALLGAVAGLLGLALVGAAPASAHVGDPSLRTVLHEVTPALPDGVDVGLRTTVADVLEVTNPTPVPFEVLDPAGTPFLRVSAAGVEGDLASPWYRRAAAPPEVPVPARPAAPARWTRLADGPTWSWFDPRTDPGYLQVPPARATVAGVEEVASWSVPVRYGTTAATLHGALERRPVQGRFETTLDPVPDGLSAVLTPGFVPSITLQVPAGRTATVAGRDGTDFLRFTADGLEIGQDGPTYREDLWARGQVVPTGSGWRPLGPTRTVTWDDIRLRFPAEDPPAQAAAATAPVEVARWRIPVVLDGSPTAMTGTVRWLPDPRAADPSPWPTIGIAAAGVLLVAGAVALARRSRRLTAPLSVTPEETREPQPTP